MVLKANHRIKPATARPQSLVVILHGAASCGEDLLPLAQTWSRLLPETEFLLPNAPQAYDGGMSLGPEGDGAFQWFSLSGINFINRLERVDAAAQVLTDFIDRELDRRGLEEHQLALAGFSQGAIMTLSVGLRRRHPFAGLLGYSGRLIDADRLAAGQVTARPRTFLIHGAEDEIIPVAHLFECADTLQALRVPVLAWPVVGLNHTIHPEGEAVGGAFLRHCLEDPTQQDIAPFAQNLEALPKAFISYP